ncbi:hypothetical protein RIR_jg39463.t1 [Rhizophagus irregularis DAOM 181602=DAOM 197198]|nr:hypothetical protein RIR_jg39463.t1 [Rhizophagus irregularis DAOM 181602=DAOM 197198]
MFSKSKNDYQQRFYGNTVTVKLWNFLSNLKIFGLNDRTLEPGSINREIASAGIPSFEQFQTFFKKNEYYT